MPQGDLLHTSIRAKLRSLKTSIQARLVGEGLGWLVLTLVAVVFVTLALDYLLRLERPYRVVMMLLCLGGIGYIVWRALIAPLAVPIDTPSLAILAERRYRQLGDRLISALQFSHRQDLAQIGVSEAMIDRMAQQANEIAQPLDFKRIVRRKRMWQALGGAGAATVLLALFAIFQVSTMSLWFQRNVLFAQVDWPQQTYLVVGQMNEEGEFVERQDFEVLRGEDLQVVVTVREGSIAPQEITLNTEYESIGEVTPETIEIAPDGSKRYIKIFQGVPEELTFYVTGGDDKTDARNPHHVTLIDPPTLHQLEFTVEYPKYQNQKAGKFGSETAILPVPVGSKVIVRGVASKPLDPNGFEITLDEQVIGKAKVLPHQNNNGNEELRAVYGEFSVTGPNEAASRTLRFILTDAQGHVSRRGHQYVVQVQKDQPPVVQVEKIDLGAVIAPEAQLPFRIKANDAYGLTKLQFAVKINDQELTRLGEPIEVPLTADGLHRREYMVPQRVLDLQQHPELEIQPGDTLRVFVLAEDNYQPANVGESSAVNLKVIEPGDLLRQLLQQQKNVAVSLGVAAKEQGEAQVKVAAVATYLANKPIDADVLRRLGESSTSEASVSSEIAKASDQLGDIRRQMELNRVATADQISVLTRSIEALDVLRPRLEDSVIPALNEMRTMTDSAELAGRARVVAKEQEVIYQALMNIREELDKLTDRMAMANEIKGVLEEWKKIGVDIGQLLEEQRGGIWDDADDDDDD